LEEWNISKELRKLSVKSLIIFMKLLIVFLLDFYDEYTYRILLKDLGRDAYNTNIKTKRILFLLITLALDLIIYYFLLIFYYLCIILF